VARALTAVALLGFVSLTRCGVSFTGGSGGEDTSTSGSGAGAAGGGAGTSSSGPGGDGTGGAGGTSPSSCVPTAGLGATVAACIDVNAAMPSPPACQAIFPNDLFIDQSYSGDGQPYHAFLRFELGTTSAEVASLTLHGVVTDTSDASGEVWRIVPFGLADLSVGNPANVGAQPIAQDLGAVTPGTAVQWTLLPSDIAPDGNLYVAIRPTTSDGVRYFGNSGTTPMRLEVTCLP
jgi:hypothetical protein